MAELQQLTEEDFAELFRICIWNKIQEILTMLNELRETSEILMKERIAIVDNYTLYYTQIKLVKSEISRLIEYTQKLQKDYQTKKKGFIVGRKK